jgi:hypothetical protein
VCLFFEPCLAKIAPLSCLTDCLCLGTLETVACAKLLVLCGESYVTRLWCVWELYTFFAVRSDLDRMKLEFLSAEDNFDALASFDVANAHCFSPDDEARLRNVIEVGGAENFNELIRDCAIKMGVVKQEEDDLRKTMLQQQQQQQQQSKNDRRKRGGAEPAATSFSNPMHGEEADDD